MRKAAQRDVSGRQFAHKRERTNTTRTSLVNTSKDKLFVGAYSSDKVLPDAGAEARKIQHQKLHVRKVDLQQTQVNWHAILRCLCLHSWCGADLNV